jgi:hypothetical protein
MAFTTFNFKKFIQEEANEPEHKESLKKVKKAKKPVTKKKAVNASKKIKK